jgi:hypothetical protein
MLVLTHFKEARAAALAASVTATAVALASRSSGATCCACSSAARSGQQQWQRMRPVSQIGKRLKRRSLALLQKQRSTANNMQKQ